MSKANLLLAASALMLACACAASRMAEREPPSPAHAHAVCRVYSGAAGWPGGGCGPG